LDKRNIFFCVKISITLTKLSVRSSDNIPTSRSS